VSRPTRQGEVAPPGGVAKVRLDGTTSWSGGHGVCGSRAVCRDGGAGGGARGPCREICRRDWPQADVRGGPRRGHGDAGGAGRPHGAGRRRPGRDRSVRGGDGDGGRSLQAGGLVCPGVAGATDVLPGLRDQARLLRRHRGPDDRARLDPRGEQPREKSADHRLRHRALRAADRGGADAGRRGGRHAGLGDPGARGIRARGGHVLPRCDGLLAPALLEGRGGRRAVFRHLLPGCPPRGLSGLSGRGGRRRAARLRSVRRHHLPCALSEDGQEGPRGAAGGRRRSGVAGQLRAPGAERSGAARAGREHLHGLDVPLAPQPAGDGRARSRGASAGVLQLRVRLLRGILGRPRGGGGAAEGPRAGPRGAAR
jgi:hypothetical protein